MHARRTQLSPDEIIQRPESRTAPERTIRRRVAFVGLRLGLLIIVIWALRRELAGVSAATLGSSLRAYNVWQIALALGCTAASFITLGGIELLALRNSESSRIVPRRAAMLTAFVAHAFGQSVGLSLLTGTAVRKRAYARFSLDWPTVTRTSVFVMLTVVLGLLTTGAGALLASTIPLRLAGLSGTARPVGLLLVLIVATYVGWSISARQVTLVRWHLKPPSLPTAAAQIVVSSLDWLVTGTVFLALIPASVNVADADLLRIFLVAQTLGVVSHIPGGVGVFEVVVLSLAPVGGVAGHTALVAALVMYRVVYYVLPLVVAGVVAVATDLLSDRDVAAPLPRRRHHGIVSHSARGGW